MKWFRWYRWRSLGLVFVSVVVWFALWGGDNGGGGTSANSGEPNSADGGLPVFARLQPAEIGGLGQTNLLKTGAEPTAPIKPPAPVKPAAPQPLSDRVVEYHIGVELNAEEKTLNGSQTVTWRNPGRQPVREMYFHLYPNAFQSDKSTFNRESGGKLRDDTKTENSTGHMRITSLKTTDGVELTHGMTYVQPDDGNKMDASLMKVRLPQPVRPNDTVTLKLDFEVQLPEVFARMGYSGDFVMAGQWFPKIAAYEPAGRRNRTVEGWNAHQYHGNSEFYADFGIYNVKIKVPSHYVVAATGFPPSPAVTNKAAGTKTYHFYADDVHDFAWAASPNFIYAEEPFSAPGVPGIKIKLYLDPKHLELKERYILAVKKSLEHYSKWYGAYPYSTLSVVVPPAGAGGAGGMEYPTLITAWEADTANVGYALERVIVHEIGHQYWYGMVANNEFEEAWLDEGFTSYSEDKVMEAAYGVSPNPAVEALYVTNPAALTRFSWNFKNHDHYADNVYIRGKLVLLAIEREIGEAQMKRVLRTYFERWKFKHPSTSDFQRTLENATRRSWSAFFDQFVYGDLMADYAIDRIEAKRSDTNKALYEYTVYASARSGKDGPVSVHFVYDDGQTIRQQWQAEEDEVVFRLPPYHAKLNYAVIDPDHEVVLEHKRINNFLKTEIDKKSAARWSMGTAKIIEAMLGIFVW